MDESLKHHNPNPLLRANPISKLFYWWMNPLFKKGYARQLEVEDMYNVVAEDHSELLGERLEQEWLKEVDKSKDGKSKPSLFKALIRIFGLEYMLFGLVLFAEEATKVIQPLLLGGLIRYFTPESTMSATESYLYAAGVSLCAIVIAIAHHPYFFGVQRIGMKMRIACCSLLYRKSLRLSSEGLGKTTTGQIVNLMSNDVNRFDQAVIFLHFLWIGPLEAVAVLAILWKELGPSTLAGLAVLLLLVPVQGWMGKLFSKFRQKTAKYTDERIRLMNEIIAGMRVIKMYCWEKPFGDLVRKVRRQESKKVKIRGYMNAVLLGQIYASIKIITVVVFTTFVYTGGVLLPEIVFVSTGLYYVVRLATTLFVPLAVQTSADTFVTLKRMELKYPSRYNTLSEAKRVLSINADNAMPDRSEYRKILQKANYRVYLSTSYRNMKRLLVLLIVIFHSYAYGKPILPEEIFVVIPFIALLVETVVMRTMFFQSYMLGDMSATAKRLVTFLLLDELQVEEKQEKENADLVTDPSIHIDIVAAKWDQQVEQMTLHNVAAKVEKNKLLAVIGPVGAGKSSLLMAVLKELPLMDGKIEVKGRIAYVAQQPWVFSASLRQNIIFGNKYEKAKYDKILKACALNKDMDVMPHGDMTLIGDRGVSLSGGQRARVSLARALYMDADVYLLDDPLSAVDAAVGRHLFENVVQGYLKDKPRILVTHQLQFLQEAEQIVILKEGEMLGKGTFQELSTSGVDFSSLLKRDEDEKEEPDNYELIDSRKRDLHSKSRDHANGHMSSVRRRVRVDSSCSNHSVVDPAQGSMMSLVSIGAEFEAETVQAPEEEERHEGTVGMAVYYEYFKAGAGLLKFLVLVILCLAAQCSYIFSDWWLSHWSNQEEARHAAIIRLQMMTSLNDTTNSTSNITIPDVDTHYNVAVFSGIIGTVFLFGLLRALMFFKVAVDASQNLHNRMFASILRSHIGFFDNNPVGRILNRFSKDVGHMDDLLPITFFDFVQCFLLIVGIVIVSGVVNPWVFIVVGPLIVLFVVIRRYYIRTSRHIKRLEGTTRSPVFSHLSASLQGLHTIRAFGVQSKFIEEFDNHQDLHTEAWFLFLTSSRWLAVRLDWLCAMFITAVSFSCVLAAESLNAGLVGLSMTYAMTLMGMFQWGVRQSAEVENQMISVERVLDYSNLPSEAALEVDEANRPPSDWPQHGTISASGASLRYSTDAPTVLKELCFTIRAREKVGIVGRTGAGKSSLITMLFRLVEPSGQITIDNVVIQTIGLHDLRKHISIIPQDPVLFTGTLRRNLDPFSMHNDDALWTSLSEVQLKNAIEDLPQGLDSEVSEGGINFSVGQRQLICLARAILRNNKILMIDEATANVDPRTDAQIQVTIREKFSNCTVLTIAHRLHTIMDSDRVLVLDEGQIIEFDAPYLLLQKPNGMFRKLVEQTGKTETVHLLEIAKTAYTKSVDENGADDNESVDNDGRSYSVEDISMVIDAVDKNREPAEDYSGNVEAAGDQENVNNSQDDNANKESEQSLLDKAGEKESNDEKDGSTETTKEEIKNKSDEIDDEEEATDEKTELLEKGKDEDKATREDEATADDLDESYKSEDEKDETKNLL